MSTITFNPPPNHTVCSGGGFNLVWDGNSWARESDYVDLLRREDEQSEDEQAAG